MTTPTREQVVQSFELAKEDWLAHDDWQFADREAMWKFFYLHGRADLEAELESLRNSLKGISDVAFDALNGPQSGYYEGLKNIMDRAIAAAPKEN